MDSEDENELASNEGECPSCGEIEPLKFCCGCCEDCCDCDEGDFDEE